jgi:hypothetical protein
MTDSATLAAGDGVEVSIRHMGDANRVRVQMRAAIRQAMAQLEPLIAAIQVAAGERLADVSDRPISELLLKLAKANDIGEERAQAWTQTYERGYASSPTTWGLTSAITEAAQAAGPWYQQAEEEAVAANVLNVGIRKALGF